MISWYTLVTNAKSEAANFVVKALEPSSFAVSTHIRVTGSNPDKSLECVELSSYINL